VAITATPRAIRGASLDAEEVMHRACARDLVDARGELSPESSCWDSEFRALITFHMPSDTIRGASRKKTPSVRCRTVLVGQGTLNGGSSVSATVQLAAAGPMYVVRYQPA